MDNAQKAIMIGVGLFITIIIIAAVMLITGAGQDLTNSAMGELAGISSSLQSQLTSQYDGTTLTGSEVVAAVKANYKKEGMVIIVNNGSGDYSYGVFKGTVSGSKHNYSLASGTYTVDNNPTTIGYLSNKQELEYYVNPTVRYNADLLKYGGGVVGIYFHLN